MAEKIKEEIILLKNDLAIYKAFILRMATK